MKAMRYFTVIILLVMFNQLASVQHKIKSNSKTSFTEKGIVAPEAYFIATVWANMNVKPDEGYYINMGNVPELIEVFDNFAFDVVISHDKMD